MSVDGLLQSGSRFLARGLPARRHGRPTRETALPRDAQINRLARVVISLRETPRVLLPNSLINALDTVGSGGSLLLSQVFGLTQELTHFDATHFRDFIWRALFAKTLDARHLDAVVAASFRVASVPWGAMHRFGMLMRIATGCARYPRLDTRGYDVMIAETPYPARLTRGTRMVVRYHDAIPLLMPHTISDKAYHQASHYQALRANVREGAYFSCVSEATRADLVSIFPEAEPRAVTIPNMVSEAYFPEDSPRDRVPEILRTRRHAAPLRAASSAALAGRREERSNYLLMVSTIEPRKNHLALLSAWERLRAEGRRMLRLVLVGGLGWSHEPIVRRFKPWLESGELVMLENVPADELRLLYRHAAVTVCPSLYEGFDFSGVEAMRSGGIVAASDIAVHRGVFADGARYFNPYSVEALAGLLARLLGESGAGWRGELLAAGARVSAGYLPERILPQWQAFLHQVHGV
ncbi:MAG: glycosyltransferase family 1 protein [Burkholderiaceae bacterium]